VDPFTVSVNIARPREEVFEYLADIGNHAEFTDHYLVDWHLTRVETYGEGAGARFRVKAPLSRFAWADVTLAELQPPFKIVERGRGGKFNRIKMIGTYEIFETHGPGDSRVEYTYETDASLPSDVIPEILGGRSWSKRKAKKAMKRLRAILEENRMRGKRPSVAAR
jgi:carbon monoxide dehydrogenase subunit G